MKPEYQRAVVVESWNYHLVEIVDSLLKHGAKSDVACYKVISLLHCVLRDGTPKIFEVSSSYTVPIRTIVQQFAGSSAFGKLLTTYEAYLTANVDFHKSFPLINGGFGMSEFKALGLPFHQQERSQLLNELMAVLQVLMTYCSAVTHTSPMSDFRLFPLVTCIRDSYGIYQLCLHIINEIYFHGGYITQNQYDTFAAFHSQLQKFYTQCTSYPYILSQMNVPTLNDNLVEFKQPHLAQLSPQQAAEMQRQAMETQQRQAMETQRQQALAQQQAQQQALHEQQQAQQRAQQQAILQQQQEAQRLAMMQREEEDRVRRALVKEQKRQLKLQNQALRAQQEAQAQQQAAMLAEQQRLAQLEQQRQAQLAHQHQQLMAEEEAVRQQQAKMQRKMQKQQEKQLRMQQQQAAMIQQQQQAQLLAQQQQQQAAQQHALLQQQAAQQQAQQQALLQQQAAQQQAWASQQLQSPQQQRNVGAVSGDFLSFGSSPYAFNPFATNVLPSNTFNSNPGNANPFMTVVNSPTQNTVNPFATNVPVNNSNPFATNVTQTVNPFATTVAPTVNPVVASKEREEMERQIRELEAKYAQLLEVFKKLQEENEMLRNELAKKDGGLSQSHAELESRMEQQQKQFLEANKQIRTHLEATRQNYENEKKKLVSDQIAFAKNTVHQYLFRFDDHNFAGNLQANGEDVKQGASQVQEAYDRLVKATLEGGDTVEASRQLAQRMQKLLEDAKGLATKVDDPELRLKLIQGTRNLTNLAGGALATAQDLIGRRPNAQEREDIVNRQRSLHTQVHDLQQAISFSGKKNMDNLDSLAEMELSNASRIIAEAAESLRRQAQLQKEKEAQQLALGFDISEIQRRAGGSSNVGAIALSVTAAAQMLLEAATEAQKERVARGVVAADKGEAYHVDPMWAEGLISAAKSVASSMKVLCGAANNALNGNVDEAQLVSCCRAVAAHTGKLQLSAKVKADRDSPAQIKMDKASKLVKDTTGDLVTETKRVADFEEVDIGLKIKDTEVGNIRAEMELEALVSQFRADVDKASQLMLAGHKGTYSAAREGAEAKLGAKSAASVKSLPAKKPSQQVVDSSPIVSPFGKGPSLSSVDATTSSTRLAQTTETKVTPPSFANLPENIDTIDENLIIPSYMKNKLTQPVDASAAKFDKALSSKAELQVKARPLHLQHDLNSELSKNKAFLAQASNSSGNNFSSATVSTTSSSGNVTATLGSTQSFLPPPTTEPSPFTSSNSTVSSANPFLAGGDANPFLTSSDNPFLPPPSTDPSKGSSAPINPFF